jgi:hypothetical protein
MRIKGDLPGMYTCVVKPSRRNSENIKLHLHPALVTQLRRIGRGLQPAFDLEFETPCLCMNAGVLLNGRRYKQGDRYPLHLANLLRCLTSLFVM